MRVLSNTIRVISLLLAKISVPKSTTDYTDGTDKEQKFDQSGQGSNPPIFLSVLSV
jgi:hypothetical protein